MCKENAMNMIIDPEDIELCETHLCNFVAGDE